MVDCSPLEIHEIKCPVNKNDFTVFHLYLKVYITLLLTLTV